MPVTAGSVKHGAERGVACVDDEDDGPTMKARDGHPKVELSCRERDGDKRERVTQTNHKLLPPCHSQVFDTRGTLLQRRNGAVDVTRRTRKPFHMWGPMVTYPAAPLSRCQLGMGKAGPQESESGSVGMWALGRETNEPIRLGACVVKATGASATCLD